MMYAFDQRVGIDSILCEGTNANSLFSFVEDAFRPRRAHTSTRSHSHHHLLTHTLAQLSTIRPVNITITSNNFLIPIPIPTSTSPNSNSKSHIPISFADPSPSSMNPRSHFTHPTPWMIGQHVRQEDEKRMHTSHARDEALKPRMSLFPS